MTAFVAGSALRSRRIASIVGATRAASGAWRIDGVGRRCGSGRESCGPPSSKSTGAPMASAVSRMSAKTIAASTSKRSTGSRLTWAASSGERQRSRNGVFARTRGSPAGSGRPGASSRPGSARRARLGARGRTGGRSRGLSRARGVGRVGSGGSSRARGGRAASSSVLTRRARRRCARCVGRGQRRDRRPRRPGARARSGGAGSGRRCVA